MPSPVHLKFTLPVASAVLAGILFWIGFSPPSPSGETGPTPRAAPAPAMSGEAGPATAIPPGLGSAGEGVATRGSGPGPMAAFPAWAERYAEAAEPARRALEERGIELARERREVMRRLIRDDPEAALALAFPRSGREALPGSVTDHLEAWVAGSGELEVYGVTKRGKANGAGHGYRRYAHIAGETYRAFAYGRRLEQPSQADLSLHGVALDGMLALHESPLRRMEPGESIARTGTVFEVDCATGGMTDTSRSPREVAPDAVAAETPEGVFLLCGGTGCAGEHFMALSDDYIADTEDGWMPRLYETRGEKRILVMPVRFEPEDDDEGAPIDPPEAEAVAAGLPELNDYLRANSFQQFSFRTMLVTETLTLTLPEDGDLEPGAVLAQARAAARDAGYVADYEFDMVVSGGIAGMPAGFGLLGGRGAWVLGDFHPGVAAHELGHNFGLFHSWYWEPAGPLGDYPVENGRTVELGNVFDIMSGAEAFPRNHFNATFKYLLRWLPDVNTHRIPEGASTGTYRLHRLDGGASLALDRAHAIRVLVDDHRDFPDAPIKDYWIEFRRLFEDNERASEGVLVSWGDEGSRTGNHLINLHPDALAGTGIPVSAEDAPLGIGETFSDPLTGLHITPLERGGASPHEYIDVAVTRGVLEVGMVNPEAAFTVINPGGPVQLPLNEPVSLRAEAWATGSPIDVVEILVGDDVLGEAEPVSGGFELPFTFLGFDPGHYELRARVRNQAGNEAVSDSLAIEITAPVPQVELRVSRDEIVLGEEVELTVIDPDEGAFFTITEAAFLVEGEPLGTRSEAPFVLPWTPTTTGDFLLQVRVTFDSGDVVESAFVSVFVLETDFIPELPLLFSWFARDGGTGADLFDVVFDGTRFLAVGAAGTLLESAGGRSWTRRETGIDEHLRGIARGDDRYVISGNAGTLLESEDGAAWVEMDSLTIRDLRAVTYGAGRFVAVGADGRIRLRDEDGTWRTRFAGDFISLRDVTYGAGRFVAVGEGGHVVTSLDGLDWTRRQAPVSAYLRGVAHGGGRFVAVGHGPVVLVSDDGETWTEHEPSTAEDLHAVHFAGQLFVAAGTRGAIVTSDDGESWVPNAGNVPETLERVAFGAQAFVIVGRNGVILQSGQTGYANWLHLHFDGGAFTDPDTVGPLADPGGWGIPNLHRFALGLDPVAPERSSLPRMEIVSDETTGDRYLTLRFQRRTDSGDAAIRVESSGDLREWEILGEDRIVEVISEGHVETVTVRDSVPVDDYRKRFMRLRVALED